jgi:hypothetical protein
MEDLTKIRRHRAGINDLQVQLALEQIVQYAVHHATEETTRHVHLRKFHELSIEQRRTAVDQLLWLALDVLASHNPEAYDGSLWMDVLIENLVAYENWQERLLPHLSCRNEQPA